MDDTNDRRDVVTGGAPKITRQSIEALIDHDRYFFDGTLTVCVLTLRNGYKVVGTSACASPENFDEDVGIRFAKEAAIEKIWPLEGYRLRCELASGDALSPHSDVYRYREALLSARIWHEAEDKSISKSGRSDIGAAWSRDQHREQIDAINAALN